MFTASLREAPLSRQVAHLVLAGTIVLAVAYAGFMALRLPDLPLEQTAGTAGPAFRTLDMVLRTQGVVLLRGLSVLLFGVTCFATAQLMTRAGGDAPLGAFLAFLWPWFPPAVGLHAVAAPYAVDIALMSVALAAAWPGPDNSMRGDGLAATVLTVLALVDPLGAWAALGTAFLLLLLRPRLWSLFGPAIGAALGILAIVGWQTSGLPTDGLDPAHPFVDGALRPYGLVWAAAVLALVSAQTAVVRQALGLRTIVVCRTAGVLYAGLVALQMPHGGGAVLAAGAVFLPFALIAILPLAAWIRFAMPTVRAVWAWIAFPVIMYCGFWLVLGPVKAARFPYALVKTAMPVKGEDTGPKPTR